MTRWLWMLEWLGADSWHSVHWTQEESHTETSTMKITKKIMVIGRVKKDVSCHCSSKTVIFNMSDPTRRSWFFMAFFVKRTSPFMLCADANLINLSFCVLESTWQGPRLPMSPALPRTSRMQHLLCSAHVNYEQKTHPPEAHPSQSSRPLCALALALLSVSQAPWDSRLCCGH